MKRIIGLLLLCAFMLGCFGCNSTNENEINTAVIFYYCTSSVSYDTEEAVLSAEKRNAEGYGNDLKFLLDLYFKGPVSDELVSPFPADLTAEEITRSNNRVLITLSDAFSELNGLDSTLASVCIAKTVQELMQVDFVHLSYENSATGKRHNMAFGPDSFLLSDNTIVDSETEE